MYAGRVLIYGGRGALGAICVKNFKKQQWWVGCIDLNKNEEADANILVKIEDDWMDQESSVVKQAGDALDGEKVDAVICVAGGWAGGNATSPDFIKNSDLMWKQSVWASAIAASLAAKFLNEGGLLTLPGANPAKDATPGMIGYGMAKAAVHQLTKSLSGEGSGMPGNGTVLAILPITLDTPMNRKWMPKADTSTWTPLEFIADLFLRWSKGEERPNNGSLITLVTKDNQTKLEIA